MPYDASWNFSRLQNWATDKAAGIKVRADRSDTELDGIAAALTAVGQKKLWLTHAAFGAQAVLDGNGTASAPSLFGAEGWTLNAAVTAINETFTSLAVGSKASCGENIFVLLDPAINATDLGVALIAETQTKSTNAKNFNTVHGSFTSASHFGSGNITDELVGSYNTAWHNSPGSTVIVAGETGHAYVSQGTVTTMFGTAGVIDVFGVSTVTYAAALATNNYLDAAATITNLYHLWIGTTGNSGGATVTNHYGIYISDLHAVGANAYNLYSAGALAKNRFDGPVLLADGSAAIPALYFSSDPDTGIYHHSGNNIGFAANGVHIGHFGPFFSELTGSLDVTNNQNADTYVGAVNNSAGVAAYATVFANNGTAAADIEMTYAGINVPAYGAWLGGEGALYSSVNLNVMADGVGKIIRFEAGGSAEIARINGSGLTIAAGKTMSVGASQVVTARQTGWTAATGAATRTTFATGSVTLSDLAERVKALLDDLITHGLVGA